MFQYYTGKFYFFFVQKFMLYYVKNRDIFAYIQINFIRFIIF